MQYCETQHCLKVALYNSGNPPILVSFANRGCKKGTSQLPIRLFLNGIHKHNFVGLGADTLTFYELTPKLFFSGFFGWGMFDIVNKGHRGSDQ